MTFFLAHIVLVLIMDQSRLVATLHALVTFAFGAFVLFRDDEPDRVMCVAAYIVGAELIWRGTGAGIFWESGKYVMSALLMFNLFKRERFFASSKLPFAYLILLLPSTAMLPVFDREAIAFNLSGPLALAIAAVYFSTIDLTRVQLKRILLSAVAPIVGLAFLASYQIFTAEYVSFIPGTKGTAAGIGPNQVSSILGFGALLAFFYAFLEDRSRFLRILAILVSVWLVLQTALTLSRGGLWGALGAIAVAAFYLARERQTRGLVFAGSGVVFLFVSLFALPWLDDFSRGALYARLQDTGTTGRDKIIQADILAYQQYPVFGLGPGQSYDFHAVTFRPSSPHTEYSRVLAEHGSLGLISMLILFGMSVQRALLKKTSKLSKAVIVSCTFWTLFYMVHAALRLAAPALMFGLASANFLLEQNDRV